MQKASESFDIFTYKMKTATLLSKAIKLNKNRFDKLE